MMHTYLCDVTVIVGSRGVVLCGYALPAVDQERAPPPHLHASLVAVAQVRAVGVDRAPALVPVAAVQAVAGQVAR